ncbi:MAG TPA: SDR family oxidoreductase [Candidatus Limnocylindria bacterium]|jgi:dTDP-4-dehydrorhamnose reductase|nr:SDR family oxidoreductase [Candidatus Limnocylindria bacterium]
MKTNRPTVWVTGAGGLIGSHLLRHGSPSNGWQVRALDRQTLNLADFPAVDAWFWANKPEAVIHCAAISKTTVCQKDPPAAWLNNLAVTEHLARLCGEIPFVFFSTDLVFGGESSNYREDSPTGPKNLYGETKVAAEQVVLRNPNHLVIRTSINFGESPTGDRAFNEDMLAGWRRGTTLSLFVDEFRNPLGAAVTAEVTLALLSAGAKGLFHVAGGERLSRFQIGEAVKAYYARRIAAGKLDLSPEKLRTVSESLVSYQGPPRCPDASLDVSKVENFLGRRMPQFTEWIATQS